MDDRDEDGYDTFEATLGTPTPAPTKFDVTEGWSPEFEREFELLQRLRSGVQNPVHFHVPDEWSKP